LETAILPLNYARVNERSANGNAKLGIVQ